MFKAGILFKLAWRNVWRHRRRSLISVASIAFGLALALFFLSLADGVYAQMINDAVRMNAGHFTCQHPAYADAPAVDLVVDDVEALREAMARLDGVVATKALILGQGVAKSGRGVSGVAVMGIEPEAEAVQSPIAKNIVAGRYLAGDVRRKIVVGVGLAERLALAVGSKLVLTSNNAEGELVEELFRVQGIFRIGSDELDRHLVQLPIGSARHFYGLSPDTATQVGAVVEPVERRDEVMAHFAASVAKRPVVVLPWEEILPELASYVRIDRSSNEVFQGIIIFLCLFTIVNTILMSVLERTREFAMMLALGTSLRALRWQIFVEATLMGLMGVLLGLSLGGTAAYVIEVNGLDISTLVGEDISVSGFAVDTLIRARVTPAVVLGLGTVVQVATMSVGLLATSRVAKISVTDVLRAQAN